jgi:hypothetical protein
VQKAFPNTPVMWPLQTFGDPHCRHWAKLQLSFKHLTGKTETLNVTFLFKDEIFLITKLIFSIENMKIGLKKT